jgi:hypothetical protein
MFEWLLLGVLVGVAGCVALIKVRRKCSWRDAMVIASGAGGPGTPEDEG